MSLVSTSSSHWESQLNMLSSDDQYNLNQPSFVTSTLPAYPASRVTFDLPRKIGKRKLNRNSPTCLRSLLPLPDISTKIKGDSAHRVPKKIEGDSSRRVALQDHANFYKWPHISGLNRIPLYTMNS